VDFAACAKGSYFPGLPDGGCTFTQRFGNHLDRRLPELHGIVADTWYDRREHKPTLAALDKLQGTTLSDEVVAADSRNRGLWRGRYFAEPGAAGRAVSHSRVLDAIRWRI
jgi:hypothetical protein